MQLNRKLLLAIFLISGAAGLIYEVVWVRLLTLVFGGTTYAVSTILFAFMGGLAIGAYMFARKIDRMRNPLFMYGLLEVGIGVYAVFTPAIISNVNEFYLQLFTGDISNQLIYSLVRFFLCVAIIIVPTILMGATLPVLSRYFVRDISTVGSTVGILYAINTTGAILGTLLAGFYLEAYFGIQNSIVIASTVNITIGCFAMWASFRAILPASVTQTESVSVVVAENDGSLAHGIHPGIILVVAAISGICTLGYEVLWFRALKLAMFNTTYAFTIMLATFLTGLSLGAYFVSRRLDSREDWAINYVYISLLVAVVSAISLPLFLHFYNTYFLLIGRPLMQSFDAAIVLQFLLAGFVILIPATLMGFILPIANKIYADDLHKVGKRVGSIYAVNTVGGMIGSVMVGFVLIPAVGTLKGALVLSMLYVFSGFLMLWSHPVGHTGKRYGYVVGVFVFIFLTFSFMFIQALTHKAATLMPGTDTVYFKEGASSTVTVVERNQHRAAFVDGNMVVSTSFGPLQTVRMLAHLPMLLHHDPKKVAIVGFGMGVTTYSASLYPDADIVVVEIAPEIIGAAPYFDSINHKIYNEPGLRVVFEDGRNFLLRSKERFDVITADPTHPILGSGNLYTKDYYELCSDRLNADGLMVQYLPLHLLPAEEFRALLWTFSSVFPEVTLWYSATDLVLLGSKQPLGIDIARLQQRISLPDIRRDLSLSSLDSVEKILSHFIMSGRDVHGFAEKAYLNTDDHPRVEFAGPRAVGSDTRLENLSGMLNNLSDIDQHILTMGNGKLENVYSKSTRDIMKTRRLTLQGLLAEFGSDYRSAMWYYRQALGIMPDSGTATYLIETLKTKIRT